MSTPSPELPSADSEVDATGLKCPLPILRAKKALAQMSSGAVLKVVTTDRMQSVTSRHFANRRRTPCWHSIRKAMQCGTSFSDAERSKRLSFVSVLLFVFLPGTAGLQLHCCG